MRLEGPLLQQGKFGRRMFFSGFSGCATETVYQEAFCRATGRRIRELLIRTEGLL